MKPLPDESLRLLIENVRDYAIIMLDTNGMIVSWNAGAERIKGYKREEVLGRHFSMFYTEEDRVAQKATDELRVAVDSGRFEEVGWRMRKDGTRFRANVILTPVRNDDGVLTGFAKITRDITASVAAQEALRLSEERFRLMVASVQDYAIFTLLPDGTVASWNTGAQRINGYTAAEIIGRHFSIFYTEDDLATGKTERELQIARETGRYEEEGWRVRKDGSIFWSNVVISTQRDEHGVVRGFTKVTRDMTERKRAADAQADLARRLMRSNEELERFASVASHDLQEPLRKILSFGDQLVTEYRDTLPDEGRFYVDRMTAAAMRMRMLIDDLLAYSRVNSRPSHRVPVDLGEVLQGVLSDLETRISDLRADIRVGELPRIDGDPLLMRQLLQNLVSNALKFHKPGVAPTVEITARRIEHEGSPKEYEIIVRDDGIGFDAQYQERIFRLFERLHTRDQYEGTGLGLSICRRIAERQGGSISAESSPGNGATFTIRLPLRFEAARD